MLASLSGRVSFLVLGKFCKKNFICASDNPESTGSSSVQILTESVKNRCQGRNTHLWLNIMVGL